MKKLISFFILCLVPCALCLVGGFAAHAAPDLTGMTTIAKTADTGLNAKNAALAAARSKVFMTVASKYADENAIKRATPSDVVIQNIISTTSIDNEKIGATDYSADVTIVLDQTQLSKWFAERGIQNNLDAAADNSMDGGQMTSIVFYIRGLRDWVNISDILNAAGLTNSIGMSVQSIYGSQATATIAASKRTDFVSALRRGGWNVTDKGGYLQVNK